MLQRGWLAIAVVSAVFVTGAAPASAFDGGPHSEIIGDAMGAEGFGGDAIGVAQVDSWFVDLYEQATTNPFSGHAGFVKRLLAGAVKVENWPDKVILAASRSHFDITHAWADATIFGHTVGIAGEWNRLRKAIWTLVQEAREENDPEKLVMVLGMSLHEVQDFYAHTNWVEPQSGLGADGPGWKGRGLGTPTWFDVPETMRARAEIYGDTSTDNRAHGFWDTDGNVSATTGMNKDWPGRPHYLEAAVTAYFASRQWIEAVRSWVHDEAFWARAQEYRADQAALHHDLEGMRDISLYSGHWQGSGEPMGGEAPGAGGSLIDLRQAAKHYFQPSHAELIGAGLGGGPASPGSILGGAAGDAFLRGKSRYRARFERLIVRMAEPNPTGELGAVPSSQSLQASMQVVVLRVLKMDGEGLGDPGPDDADMYANVRIDGEAMTSEVIHGHDHFSFQNPYEPFTWFKVIPRTINEGVPVESIEAEVKTANVRWAGTDDDVFLRLGPKLRFPLDNRLYNDFERGDRDIYSVGIDEAVKTGFEIGDISEVTIEKARDGVAGSWKLGELKLKVNGLTFYKNQKINRWLEDDHRRWEATDFERRNPTGSVIPVWLNLNEDDLVYGNDDFGDINPFGHRRTVAIGYTPGAPFQARTKGGGTHGGRRGDGDEASIVFRLDTILPEPMPREDQPVYRPAPPEKPKADPGKPDLRITSFDYTGVTVKNQGTGPVGPFRVRAGDGAIFETVTFPGLAAGASARKQLYRLSCDRSYLAIADDLQLVEEIDESNNEAVSEPALC
jgi:hypothetical protein